ncbi:uncharacterized protein LOC120186384 [Hibiscus syriacus]|uniref:uncharacterized protein LOC120186384 n=1 Tax=Hibiscus syriacus TaxID=106335 RepID=UPI001924F497|nr:uncharacterized protein LOC120186384 [Hibiscus syriacus]
MVRHPSGRISSKNEDEDEDDDHYVSSGEEQDGSESPLEATVEKRSLSAREAVTAQEAAEAAAAGGEEPVKMSLMDLLGETGYEMGEDEENEDEDEDEDNVAVSSRGGMEYTCCIYMFCRQQASRKKQKRGKQQQDLHCFVPILMVVEFGFAGLYPSG